MYTTSTASRFRRAVADEPDAASPLTLLRLRRRLGIEEAAARANLSLEDVRALEEGRIYRFRSVDDALARAFVYATALGLSDREARSLAGLPPGSEPRSRIARRAAVLAAFAAALFALVWFGVRPGGLGGHAATPPVGAGAAGSSSPALPQPWQIRVDVYNGTKKPNAAARVANRIAGLAYRIGNLGDATRSDYTTTRVYYPPGAESIARRLAAQLGVAVEALPGGKDSRRLVVIVGG